MRAPLSAPTLEPGQRLFVCLEQCVVVQQRETNIYQVVFDRKAPKTTRILWAEDEWIFIGRHKQNAEKDPSLAAFVSVLKPEQETF
ncbi:hypothetical protein [Pseudomonas nunensis]|uniref:Uncharacterized protein n=1 Tax=Pseudomonas nunensis TaxID=2961896 RepID=A0ABY5ER80_9PSED|nr:hypothetical protein [Pseudomonas nunensis]KPN90543.1 hypothetical protein AL066_09420 [Pseudomonas nunensis]MCL5225448.1 hypothetical protein [Pseudomonas nunensis]UTO16792.1 hypothetical protein NK667_10720 [Pseudomonas nunensis]